MFRLCSHDRGVKRLQLRQNWSSTQNTRPKSVNLVTRCKKLVAGRDINAILNFRSTKKRVSITLCVTFNYESNPRNLLQPTGLGLCLWKCFKISARNATAIPFVGLWLPSQSTRVKLPSRYLFISKNNKWQTQMLGKKSPSWLHLSARLSVGKLACRRVARCRPLYRTEPPSLCFSGSTPACLRHLYNQSAR